MTRAYVHARLAPRDRALLDRLRKTTGRSDSAIVRRGLELVHQELTHRPSALDVAGRSAGRFRNGPKDLSTNRRHLDDFGR